VCERERERESERERVKERERESVCNRETLSRLLSLSLPPSPSHPLLLYISYPLFLSTSLSLLLSPSLSLYSKEYFPLLYGVATISRLLKIVGLFCRI